MGLPAIPNRGRHLEAYALATGEEPVEGEAVSLSGGEISAEGADPTAILGFAMHDHGGDLAVDVYESEVIVAVARGESTFWIEGTSAPTDETDIGTQYGMAVDGDGVAEVDLTDTTNLVFLVEDVDLDRELYEVSVIESARQVDV